MLCLLASCAVDGQPQLTDETTDSAALTDGTPNGVTTFVVPQAPDSAKSDGAKPNVAPLVAAPTISPSVTTEHVPAGGVASCSVGTLCTAVWDPTVNQFKIFHLFNCTTYTVSNWLGEGSFNDSQTGNPTSVFFGQSHNTLLSFTPGTVEDFNWDPVFFIKNC
jgi:hypothetical protein